MRLICPNCDAEYEVDGTLMPKEGREVQCSNCTTTWFQKGEGSPAEPPMDSVMAAAAAASPNRPRASREALDVIHDEVARETQARKSDAGSLETQTEMGLEASTAEVLPPHEIDEAALAPAPRRRENVSKGELFPDIEEINSTLAEAPDTSAEDEEEDQNLHAAAARKRASSFRMGFGLMLLICAAAVWVYVSADNLAERFPQAAAPLEAFMMFANTARVTLENGVERLTQLVDGLIERFSS